MCWGSVFNSMKCGELCHFIAQLWPVCTCQSGTCSWAEVGAGPANITPPIAGSESFGWVEKDRACVCVSLVCAFPFTFLNVGPWVTRGQAPGPREGVGDAASGVPRC